MELTDYRLSPQQGWRQEVLYRDPVPVLCVCSWAEPANTRLFSAGVDHSIDL